MKRFSIRLLRAGLPGLAIAFIPLGKTVAHEIVGNRFFPATLGIDDPGVNDELPREVTLWFTQKLEAAFGATTVTDAAGKRVDVGKTRVSGNRMSVAPVLPHCWRPVL
jgi:methionine-rich copper-binding protein CopC